MMLTGVSSVWFAIEMASRSVPSSPASCVPSPFGLQVLLVVLHPSTLSFSPLALVFFLACPDPCIAYGVSG